jgi:hypothetical protein
MLAVTRAGNVRIVVHPESDEPHHLPQCHLIWPDGMASVRIPRGSVIAGPALPRITAAIVATRMEEIRVA